MNIFTWELAGEGSHFMEIKALLPNGRAPAAELSPTAPRCAEDAGKGHGRQLLDHTQKPQSLQGQDLISPREDTSDINSHTIADVSQKQELHKIQECNIFFYRKQERNLCLWWRC